MINNHGVQKQHPGIIQTEVVLFLKKGEQMKKLVYLFLSVICILSLAACGGNNAKEISEQEWVSRAQAYEEHSYSTADYSLVYEYTETAGKNKHKSNETMKEKYVYSEETKKWEPVDESGLDFISTIGRTAIDLYNGDEHESLKAYAAMGMATFYDDMSVKLSAELEDDDVVEMVIRFDKYGYYVYGKSVEDIHYPEDDDEPAIDEHIVRTLKIKYK